MQLDVGARYRDDRMQFELMLYALNYDDRITSVFTGDVTPGGRDIVQSVNAADSKIRGAEAGIDVAINEELRASAVLNYTWGEQRIGGSPTEPADRVPPLTGRVTLTYDPGNNIRLDSWLRFAGDQDRLSVRDVRDVRIDPAGTSGWGILGARVSVDYRRGWQFSVGADNIFDKQYRIHGSGLDAPGRNFFASVRWTW